MRVFFLTKEWSAMERFVRGQASRAGNRRRGGPSGRMVQQQTVLPHDAQTKHEVL